MTWLKKLCVKAHSFFSEIYMDQLKLYRIDMKYVRNLHNVDDRVESVSPQIGKYCIHCMKSHVIYP